MSLKLRHQTVIFDRVLFQAQVAFQIRVNSCSWQAIHFAHRRGSLLKFLRISGESHGRPLSGDRFGPPSAPTLLCPIPFPN